MTLEEKIGQLFIFGFDGTRPNRSITDLIKRKHLGGIILFERNLKTPLQIAQLTAALQSFSPHLPLLVSIDQEGGRVSRLPKEFSHFPSAAAIGRLGSVDLVYRMAHCTAKELRAVGINMNMAPVLDVLTYPANPIIGDRAFGETPDLVSAMGLAAIAGLQDNHVVACGKHFPGHGDTNADSHKELPCVNHSIERFHEVELRPFCHAIKNELTTIMTAHVLYPAIDKNHLATLSKKIVTNLLREELEFHGVVVTDDLTMKAITLEPGEAAVRALEAGVDLILIGQGSDRCQAAMTAVHAAVKQKRISEQRLDQSFLRILHLKKRFLLPFKPTDLKAVKDTVGQPSHQQLLKEVREKLSISV